MSNSLNKAEVKKIRYDTDGFTVHTSSEKKSFIFSELSKIEYIEIEDDDDHGAIGTILGSLVGVATGDFTSMIGGGIGGWIVSKFIPSKKTKFFKIILLNYEEYSFLSEDSLTYVDEIKEKLNNFYIKFLSDTEIKIKEYKKNLKHYLDIKDTFIQHSKVFGEVSNDITIHLERLEETCNFFDYENDERLKKINQNLKSINSRRKNYNENYIKHNLNNVHLKKLIPSQKRAVLMNEDNTLVNAGAGSGKTTTLIGKIIYLIEKKQCEAKEILVLAYNANVRKELIQRLEEISKKPKYSYLKELYENNIHTFHSYGYKYLRDKSTTKIIDKVSKFEEELIIKKTAQIDEIINQLSLNKEFRQNLLDFLSHYFFSYKDYFKDIDTFEDYVRYIRNIGQVTLNGEFMRSFEEVEIANFLYMNGIKYEYESEYQEVYDTGNYNFDTEDLKIKNHLKSQKQKRYHPDFYLPEYDIYLEHFALDRNNNAPSFFRNPYGYYEQYLEKKEVHKYNKTKLIETFSWMKSEGILTSKLEQKLKAHKVKFKPLKSEQLLERFKSKGKVSNLTKLLSTFMSHFKSNELQMDVLKKKVFTVSNLNNQNRTALFLNIFEKIFKKYQSDLKKENAIDYDDMIILGKEKIKNENFKHILVDEFQDISQARAKLLKKIKKENNCQLYCVGDDWQAIYKFVGGDISIFTKEDEFQKHFGYFDRVDIDTTFRYGKNINELSKGFIQKNPDQLTKEIKSTEKKNSGEIIIHKDDSFEKIISKYKDKKDKIYILGRYNLSMYDDALKRRLQKSNIVSKTQIEKAVRENPNIEYKTVHKAKGLEADIIIIVNLFSGTEGFPSQIEDDYILNLVLPNPEVYPFAEERRLFYVALTRAKKKVYLLSGESWSCSDFVKELEKDYPKLLKSQTLKKVINKKGLRICPKHNIKLKLRNGRYGEFYSCPKRVASGWCGYTENV